MAKLVSLAKLALSFLKNRAGNIAISAAVAFPIMLAATGMAIDYMTMVNSQRVLQDALDGAAVSAVASLAEGLHTEATVKDYAINLVMASVGNSLTDTEKTELKSKLSVTVAAATSSTVKTYDVKVAGHFDVKLTPFSGFLGYQRRPVGGVSSTQAETASRSALSMYVVLDRSGSMSFVTDTVDTNHSSCQNYTTANWMYYPHAANSSPCYVNKAAAVKAAANALFNELDTLEAKSSSDTIIRVGGVSFTDSMQTPQAMAWGTSSIRTYVTALPAYPTGGTDMTDGMDQAYQTLHSASETSAQTAKGNTVFSKFIVLMTDGENTGASSTWNPALDSETLSSCTAARNDGITIYAVAFMAPSNGEALLKSCAGELSNFYAANDMESLIAAFADIGNKAVEKTTRIIK